MPDNSLTEDSKTRLTQDLKDIYPGDEDFVKFKARLLGKEGDLKSAHVWLSYIPKNLSAHYESDTTFTTKIGSVPITLNFDLPLKVEKGKEISYSLNYFSNVDYPLENLSVKIDPINGFNFGSVIPSSLDNTEWKLDTLNKAQGGKISIKGVINADAGNHISFLAKLGMWQDGTFVVIKETNQDVEIIQPLLFISQQINGVSNYTASPGETLHYEIFFRNIGSTPFDNLFVISQLSGSAFDMSTLQSQEGEAKKSDSLIVFDPKQVLELQHLQPQQEVKVDFSVKLKNNWDILDSEKNNIIIKNKVDASNISQEFDTKVSSKLDFSQKVYHTTINSIENSGPIPPKVDEATTYAVVWQVKNYLNDLKNVKVKMILPQGVMLSDSMAPDDQASHFSFDNKSREIFWSVGDFAAGASISLTFQIAFTPVASQRGRLADIVGQATIYGEDQFTGVVTQTSASLVNTSLPDDQSNSGGGIVQ